MGAFSVLVVDDEKNIRQTLRVCLEAAGAQVTEAGSVQAARRSDRPLAATTSCSSISAWAPRAGST